MAVQTQPDCEKAETASLAVPVPAVWLGAFGAVPFVVLAAASFFLNQPLFDGAITALASYGAIILSFMGGVHWGLAIADFGADFGAGPAGGASYRRLGLSVVPALIGWGALFLPVVFGLPVLAVAFVLLFVMDLESDGRGEAPSWYRRLRWPLTSIVTTCLLLATLAIIGRL